MAELTITIDAATLVRIEKLAKISKISVLEWLSSFFDISGCPNPLFAQEGCPNPKNTSGKHVATCLSE